MLVALQARFVAAGFGVVVFLAACGLEVQGSEPSSGASSSGGAAPDAAVEPGGDPPDGGASDRDAAHDHDASGPCSLRGEAVLAGILCGARCVDPLVDRGHCGGCGVTCDAWEACEGTCVEVAKALSGVRHEIRCTNDAVPACSIATAEPPDKIVTLTGTSGKTYDLVVQIRGVLEQRTYADDTNGPAQGTNALFFTQGGLSSVSDTWNIYDVRISSPDWTWHLNSGVSGNTWSDLVDYQATMRANANATLTVHADSGDTAQANNRDQAGQPIVIPSLSTTPFPGQFVQLDIVSVSVVP